MLIPQESVRLIERSGVVIADPLVSPTSVPDDDVSTSTEPFTGVVEDIEPDISSPLFMTIPAGTVFSVCDDFDNGLWFWDMYEERLGQLGSAASQDDV